MRGEGTSGGALRLQLESLSALAVIQPKGDTCSAWQELDPRTPFSEIGAGKRKELSGELPDEDSTAVALPAIGPCEVWRGLRLGGTAGLEEEKED